LALLKTLRSNPAECWTKAHFEEPIVLGGFPFARVPWSMIRQRSVKCSSKISQPTKKLLLAHERKLKEEAEAKKGETKLKGGHKKRLASLEPGKIHPPSEWLWWFDIATGNMYAYERASRSFAVIDRQVADRLIARLAQT